LLDVHTVLKGRTAVRHSAAIIRDIVLPSQLQLAAGNPPEIERPAFRAYRDQMVLESGSRNVLEQTLLEQVAMAHLAASRLLANAGLAETAEADSLRCAAAAKLMGEVRRTVVAIKELRSPPAPPNITVATTQQVSVHGNTATEMSAEVAKKTGAHSEEGSKDGPGANRLREIFSENGGGAAEPETVGAAD
jgi:hypothetical protein